MNKISSNLKTHLLLVLATLFWGVTPSFVKLSLREMGAFPFSALRLTVALVVSGLLLKVFGHWKQVEKKDSNLLCLKEGSQSHPV